MKQNKTRPNQLYRRKQNQTITNQEIEEKTRNVNKQTGQNKPKHIK